MELWNGCKFVARPDCEYKFDYETELRRPDRDRLKNLVTDDLFFFCYFILQIPIANHPYVVNICREVEEGPKSGTLDLWFRGGFKSTIITIAETVQHILKWPEDSNCILSYNRSCALSFFRSVKHVLEGDETLKQLFPEVLYDSPKKDAVKWGELTGLWVRRRSTAKEATLEAHGLIDGMPTGRHYTGRIVYDDIMTEDLSDSPAMVDKTKRRFDMSLNLHSLGTKVRVLGTPYHHDDVLMYIASKKNGEGAPYYTLRKRTATVDGSFEGKSVFMPESRLAELRENRMSFFSQQLLEPKVSANMTFRRDFYQTFSEVPGTLIKFLAIDPAGDRKTAVTANRKVGDRWGITVGGFSPEMDDAGMSDCFVLDLCLKRLTYEEALNEIVRMFFRWNPILVGVEKGAVSSVEIHVMNALRARGRAISVGAGLDLITTAGGSKRRRIEDTLVIPFEAGKIKFYDRLEAESVNNFLVELDRYPVGHDDGLDSLSFIYMLARKWKFGKKTTIKEPSICERIRASREKQKRKGWLYV